MPTDEQRRRQIADSERRISDRRSSQQASQGRGESGGESSAEAFRHSGLIPPGRSGDPRDPRRSGKALDVNVIGNDQLLADIAALARGTTRGRQQAGGVGEPAGQRPANVNSSQAQAQVMASIASEMRTAAEITRQLVQATTEQTSSLRKLHDEQRDAVIELTEIVRTSARGLAKGSESDVDAPVHSRGGTRPAGPSPSPREPQEDEQRVPAGGGRGGGGRGRGGGGGGGAGGGRYDPLGLITPDEQGNYGPIHGGSRNNQFAFMSHIAGGGHPDEFDPSMMAMGGRNHPSSLHELRRNMRVSAARFVNSRYGEPSVKEQLLPQHDEEGNLSHYMHDPGDGSEQTRMEVGSEEATGTASRLAGTAARAGMISRAAGGLATGGAGMALRAIPAVGVAITAAEGVNKIAEYTTEQRAENAKYQAVLGGDNFSTGFGERLSKFGNKLSERFSGGMTGEQSDQVTDRFVGMGFDENKRDAYFETTSQNYKQYGMDPNQSADLIAVAAKTANSGLRNMADSIKAVTETAVKYGRNADEARQKMGQTAEALSDRGIKGPQVMSLAAASTMRSMELGRAGENVDFSGLATTQSSGRLAANALGMNFNEFRAQGELDGGATTAKGQDAILNRFLKPYTTGKGADVIHKLVDENGGWDKVKEDPELIRKIANQSMTDPNGPQGDALAVQMGAMGIEGVDPNDPTTGVTTLMTQMYGGGTSMSDKQKEAAEKVKSRQATPEDMKNLGEVGKKSFGERVLGQIGDFFNPFGEGSGPAGQYDTDDPNYVNAQHEKETGVVDPVIDNMLDPAKGVVGENPEDTGVEVETKEGKKVVPLNEALEKYRDQIIRGDATIIGGEHDGEKVSDIMGDGGTDPNYKNADGSDSKDSDAEDGGMSAEDWREEHPGEGGEGDGKGVNVTVTPGPELKRWFNFNTGNGGQTNDGASNGMPPAPGGGPTTNGGTPGG